MAADLRAAEGRVADRTRPEVAFHLSNATRAAHPHRSNSRSRAPRLVCAG
jgi:hypothetical protein